MRSMVRDPGVRRRALFVSGNLAMVGLVTWALVLPVQDFFTERDDRILEKQKALARLSAIVAQETKVRAVLTDTSTQLRGGEFLTGPNENAISADLQARLKTLAEAAGARSRSVQALPSKTVDRTRLGGSRIEIFGSLQSVQRAVHAIESSRPYLFTTAAVLKMQTPVTRPGASEEPVIHAQLDVFGAVLVDGEQ